jgi:hypothetical protein
MQRTFLLPVGLTVLAITQYRGQTGMHLAPCPIAAGDGEIRRGACPRAPNTGPEGGCQGFFTVVQDACVRFWSSAEPRRLSALR